MMSEQREEGTVFNGGHTEDGTVSNNDAMDARETPSMIRARGIVVFWSSSTGGDDTVSNGG